MGRTHISISDVRNLKRGWEQGSSLPFGPHMFPGNKGGANKDGPMKQFIYLFSEYTFSLLGIHFFVYGAIISYHIYMLHII